MRGYVLALLLAMLLALATAVPGFAAEEPVGGDGEIQPQVAGGDPVPGGKYPFVAALLDKTWPGSDYRQQFCGGTLIDEDSVLTAAHCVEGVLPAQLEVVGRTVLDSDEGQKRNVAALTTHPQNKSYWAPTTTPSSGSKHRLPVSCRSSFPPRPRTLSRPRVGS